MNLLATSQTQGGLWCLGHILLHILFTSQTFVNFRFEYQKLLDCIQSHIGEIKLSKNGVIQLNQTEEQ